MINRKSLHQKLREITQVGELSTLSLEEAKKLYPTNENHGFDLDKGYSEGKVLCRFTFYGNIIDVSGVERVDQLNYLDRFILDIIYPITQE